MTFLEKTDPARNRISTQERADRPKEYYRARPCGELNVEALAKDVKTRFPKVLARLAE